MTEQNQGQHPGTEPDEKDLNSKLKKRLAIAGGLVAVALAAIPVLDGMKKPKVDMTASTPAGSSGKIVNPTSAPAAEVPAAEPTSASTPVAEASAPVTDAGSSPSPAAPLAAPPQTPDISKTPAVASAKPVTAPLAHPPAGKAAGKPPTSTTSNTPNPAPPAMTNTAAPHTAASKPAPSASPVPSVVVSNAETTALPQSAPLSKAKPEGSSLGYKLQLGLFSSTGNAEKLVKELKAKGIEAHTETRVQLGPFKSRAEADEAMAKLRSLGYTALLAPAGQ
ncbi:hypothetical protein DLM_0564 [Aquitalea magnusonii]|uniref:SPOR domain-containing protein n=1 Tax=Aquitalea magnusonii TaxID=332411 RepID=A0A3G9G9K7_9NEIS|nr:SPOR domain-containing protein [Aquitalea magnusonii]BBF84225.1 hypothetical protein DLM_0564 [Aquitalea magnusonii]